MAEDNSRSFRAVATADLGKKEGDGDSERAPPTLVHFRGSDPLRESSAEELVGRGEERLFLEENSESAASVAMASVDSATSSPKQTKVSDGVQHIQMCDDAIKSEDSFANYASVSNDSAELLTPKTPQSIATLKHQEFADSPATQYRDLALTPWKEFSEGFSAPEIDESCVLDSPQDRGGTEETCLMCLDTIDNVKRDENAAAADTPDELLHQASRYDDSENATSQRMSQQIEMDIAEEKDSKDISDIKYATDDELKKVHDFPLIPFRGWSNASVLQNKRRTIPADDDLPSDFWLFEDETTSSVGESSESLSVIEDPPVTNHTEGAPDCTGMDTLVSPQRQAAVMDLTDKKAEKDIGDPKLERGMTQIPVRAPGEGAISRQPSDTVALLQPNRPGRAARVTTEEYRCSNCCCLWWRAWRRHDGYEEL